MNIPIELAKELKNLSDEFENENDRDRLRYFIQDALSEKSNHIKSNSRVSQKSHNR